MGESRTKNALRNVFFGFLNKFISLGLPFVSRTIMLYLLGVSYLGIGTLFSSVLSFLSLAELGFGSALVYSMYKPIAEKNYELVGALLKYYRKIYRVIGTIVLTIGTVLVPAIPYLMKGGAPESINVYVLYYIYLINSVISYFFAGYRQSLLTAHQRTDVVNKISMFINIFVQFGQIFALFLTRNFYVYALVPIIGTIFTNLSLAVTTKKRYPQIKCSGEAPIETKKEIKTKISGLFGTKLNSIVVHSADTLIISAFLGLSMTAKYGNYYYIMNAICGFIMVFYSSMTAGIGNKLVVDSIEENYKFFKNMNFINAWLVGWCSICLLCLYEPFMELWMGDSMKLGIVFVILMVGYFYIYMIQRNILTFKDAAGLWNKDWMRPYVSMSLNVVSNLVLVRFIGIYGIVVSTIIVFLISVPWVNSVLFKNLFKKSPAKNLFTIFKYFIFTGAIAGVTYFICELCMEGFVGLIQRVIICCVVPNIFFILFFFKTAEFAYLKDFILKNVLKH